MPVPSRNRITRRATARAVSPHGFRPWLGMALLLVALASPARECEPPGEDLRGEFVVHFENDLFANTDQNYTNGVKFTWLSPALARFRTNRELDDWQRFVIDNLASVNDWLTGRPRAEPASKDCTRDDLQTGLASGTFRRVSFSLGQNIYTPQDIGRSDLIVDDRPYAGWLYASAAFQTYDERRLDIMEVQLGVVGPYSAAQWTQTFVHEFRNIRKPRGWSNQLETEPGLVLTYERRYRFHQSLEGLSGLPLAVDLLPRAGFAVGNVHDFVTIGSEARIGWNLPKNFGNAIIRPGGDAGQLEANHGFHLHGFAAADARFVLRDLFLDGNTFAGSHSVKKERLVGDFSVGISTGYGPFRLTVARVLRTREFAQQDGPHRFGAIALTGQFALP
ncbi:MAG: lipid A deacylase LpxR family protein [Gammaproteobacteria bacterium]|nr:lipid A deacylase LpxR family protein [Gammaproteobacteria bacterium]